jgi:hypothetical protein
MHFMRPEMLKKCEPSVYLVSSIICYHDVYGLRRCGYSFGCYYRAPKWDTILCWTTAVGAKSYFAYFYIIFLTFRMDLFWSSRTRERTTNSAHLRSPLLLLLFFFDNHLFTFSIIYVTSVITVIDETRLFIVTSCVCGCRRVPRREQLVVCFPIMN